MLRVSKEDLSVSAKQTAMTIQGSLALLSDQKIDLRGDVLELEARSAMSFVSGELKIEMTPSKTSLTGPVRMETDKTVKFKGSPENVTK